MKTFLKATILLPLLALAVGWAMANRQPVEVSGDLFNLHVTPYVAEPLPLYVVVFAAMALGVVLGSFMTWNAQRRYRRQASIQTLEAHKLRNELERARAAERAAAPAPVSGSTALATR